MTDIEMTDIDRYHYDDDEVLLRKYIFLSEPHITYYISFPPVINFDTNINSSKPVPQVRAVYRFDGHSSPYRFRHEFIGMEVI